MKTERLIKKHFIELYSMMPYDKITVRKLCESVPIARTTFYSYYNNIDEAKSEIEDETISGIRSSCEKIYMNDGECYFMNAMRYIDMNREVFSAFMTKSPDMRFINKFKTEIIKHFKENFTGKADNKNFNLKLEVFASAVIGYYTYWLDHSEEIDLKEVNDKLGEVLKHLKTII